MAKNVEASVTLRADIRDLTKTLATVPGITEGEAKRMAIALEKQVKKAEAAAKAAAKNSAAAMDKFKAATDRAADSTKELGDKAGDTESGLRALGGVLGLVSPEAEKVVGTIAEFGGGLEGATRLAGTFGTSLSSILSIAGPVGIALGVLAGTYAYLASEEEKAEAATQAAADAASRAQVIYEALSGSLKSLSDDVRLVTGEIDALGLAQEKQTKEIQDAFAAQRSALKDRIATLEAEQAALHASVQSGEEYQTSLRNIRTQLSAAKGQLEALNDREQTAIDTVDLVTFGKRAEAEARKTNTKAVRDETDAKAAQAMFDAETEANLDAQLALLTELADRRKTAARSQLDQIGQIEAAMADELARLDMLTEAYRNNAAVVYDIERTKVAVVGEASDKIAEIREAEAEKSQKTDEQILVNKRTAMQVASEEFLENNERTLATYSDLAGSVAALTEEFISRVGDKNRKAAMAAFRVQQIAAISQIVINTLVAASRAVAELGPIAGPIAAAAIGATGAAQAALVAAEKPNFHMGGMLGNSGPPAPDERDVRIRRNEPVLTRQEAQNVARVASGEGGGGGGGQIVVVQKYKNRVFDAFVQDNVRRSVSPLRRAIKSGDRVGHRTR